MSNILSDLHWRYATQQFDPERKLTAEQEHILIEALRLAPSSFGMQPWKFVVVTDPALRVQLKDNAWGQPQITDASHLIVLCSVKDLDQTHIDKYIDLTAKERSIAHENLQPFHNTLTGFVKSKEIGQLNTWSQKQVYIALGVLLTTCALEKIDACPMEGFDHGKFNQILNLDQYGLESVVLCAVGFRKENDPASKKPKVRFPQAEVIIRK